jgi:Aerotolerance regulator N-terminal
MDISLLHAGLAAGAALAAIPVILHLFMRQTPKHVIFPALRLIRDRHKRSKKQLKIKNWLLLAARMLLLALMALALARPTLNSETSLGDQEVPTALAFVFDTSMSMQYTEKGNDRLTEAKLRADEILKRTTEDSEVFVIDSADQVKPLAVSPASARKRIDALTLRAANRTLNATVVLANQAVAASNLARREVYVLTDLASSAWDLASSQTTTDLEKVRKEKKGVKTYILRLTPKVVQDVAVVDAEPSASVVTEGEPVEIKAIIRSSGQAIERVAEFWLDGDNKKDQKIVKLPANGEVDVTFVTPSKLEPGLHQGRIKLSGGDSMAFDDVRYFSFTTQPSMKVLLVSDLVIDSLFVEKALSPEASIAPGVSSSPYKVERETRRQFQDRQRLSIKDFTAVFLLNVDGLTAIDWGKLAMFVREGGGLVVAPGDRSDAASYGAAGASILPATLDEKKVVPQPGTNFGKAEYDHPLFNRHPRLLDPELTAWPIYRYWSVKPLDNSRVLLRYTDGTPAILERAVKGSRTGHVLLWTTPLSRRVNREEVAAWNEFPRSWAFLDLLWQTIPYLAGTAGEKLNYEAGQDAILTVDPNRRATTYIVQGPDSKTSYPLAAPTASDTLLVSMPSKEGQWKVEGKGPDGSQMKMGFSVNVSPLEAQVVALKDTDLNGLFGGKDNYKIADDAASLDRVKQGVRIGNELFPWLMMLILALVTAENLLANKFHKTSPASGSTPERTAR